MHDFQTAPWKANGFRNHRLLLGENNPALRDYLLAVLRADGHEVVAMSNGIDLLDTLAVSLHPEYGSGQFDLVISEARMLGGAEARVFSELENRAKAPPFVLITAFRDKELHVKAEQFGALAVLDNPLDIDNLRQIVNSFLHQLTGVRGSMPQISQFEMEQIPESIGR
jgi:DNA-binding NtrC family response regulator